ncbi:Thiamine biosynthesis lipoprotein ApbE precursor [Aquisphaera giovannonii]|uniref:FAD:protein FMN transferase n=1 Tax=Aquisphaera giovannonii TaxID=406548 RepID=A0A5B9W1F1_9BACT|nr:FAD:protein FMN transferase [Aquisphaera giovannonii]QEH34383.1 Thiamine biosynthesis lipoprotein ApbE precursor [Aquisphaera giovannonii]
MNGPRPGVNRRNLFRLRPPAQPEAPAGRADAPAEESPGAGDLLRVNRPAMGSYFEVRLGAGVPGSVELATRALDLVDELEAQLTVYRDDSEVSRLNATAHLGPVEVEPGLFGLLERALELSRLTGGAYDVTAGALSDAWGFTRGPKRVPAPEALDAAIACSGWRHLRLDASARAVAFDRPGIKVNLGSIGKGYAIDRAVAVIRDHWFPTSAMVHGGQSSLFALGSPPGRFGGRWEVALRNPRSPERPLGVIRLRNRGLGTSGGAFQSFVADGEVYGHILDPRTGRPARGPASVTVLAPTAAEADALSTAFYLLGPESAREYVSSRPDLAAIFVLEDAGDERPRLLTAGLRPEDFLIDPAAVDLVTTS